LQVAGAARAKEVVAVLVAEEVAARAVAHFG
jgi:hypothetical protein